MNDVLRGNLVGEAVRIGDELAAKAIRDGRMLYWKTAGMDRLGNRMWTQSERIYDGGSGIALFFLELYSQTGLERFLDIALRAMEWVSLHSERNPTDQYGFYSGRMGVAYCSTKFFATTNDTDFLGIASSVARSSTSFLSSNSLCSDLLYGTAGTILGLLHVHSATKEEWIVEQINLFVGHMLGCMNQGMNGLFWDRSFLNAKGLCGFAHGAAGIGFVFLELGHYFQNESFYWIAEQAFNYENFHYNGQSRNWPDYRKGIYNSHDAEQHKNAYARGDISCFYEYGDMNAWCHGAAGLGMARLWGYDLLRKASYKDDVERAIDQTSLKDLDVDGSKMNFILCHGAIGNAMLFLEAYRVLNESQYLEMSEEIALKCIERKGDQLLYGAEVDQILREDTSLFLGQTGVGYFYLVLAGSKQNPSILAPRCNNVSLTILTNVYPSLVISDTEMKKRTLEVSFPKSVAIVEKIASGLLEQFLLAKPPTREGFVDLIARDLPAIHGGLCLKDAVTWEEQIARLGESTENYSLLYIRNLYLTDRALSVTSLEDQTFLQLEMSLNEDASLVQTRWDWGNESNFLDNLSTEPAIHHYVILALPEGVATTKLNEQTFALLQSFSGSPTIVKSTAHHFMELFGFSEDDYAPVERFVIDQAKSALASRILVLR